MKILHSPALSGILLIVATIAALIMENSPLSSYYDSFLHTPVQIRFGNFEIAKPLLLWVNDGLMAIFFFLIGLEVKREVLEGSLSSISYVTLPLLAALGGMAMPALIYIALNPNDPFALNGWAIPTATDIAFALGILSLIGSVPSSLKTFLLALAIIDDLGAILIIALFYTQELSLFSITIAAIALGVLIAFNLFGIKRKALYIIVGVVLWASVLKSGVHATLAGVAIAFTIPLSLAKEMEKELHLYVSLLILPLFAFVNAGVNLEGIALKDIFSPVPLGIMLGLFLGKQLGVFGFSWIAIKSGLAKLPKDATFLQLYGISVLTGIGFTMSLFIDSLAFNDTRIYHYADKLAILLGSLLSALVGAIILKLATPKR